MKNVSFSFCLFLLLSLTACQDKLEEMDQFPLQPERLTELVPLQSGKYITYRLDSTVFTNFGRNVEVHSYQEKHMVDAKIVDNIGREGFRIIRTMRDEAGLQPWRAAGTYFIVVANNKVEVIEDNLRIVKLITPVKEGIAWKGNQFLPNKPFTGLYGFSLDNSMDIWEFKYEQVNQDTSFNGFSFKNVTTINHINSRLLPDTIEVSATNQAIISSKPSIAWIRGNATDIITIEAEKPSVNNRILTIYNKSNFPARLNGIEIPVDNARHVQFVNNAWTFGHNIDSLFTDLPFANVEYSTEKYAKDVGLILQELILWENQPNIGGSSPYKVGFGVKRTLIDHN